MFNPMFLEIQSNRRRIWYDLRPEVRRELVHRRELTDLLKEYSFPWIEPIVSRRILNHIALEDLRRMINMESDSESSDGWD